MWLSGKNMGFVAKISEFWILALLQRTLWSWKTGASVYIPTFQLKLKYYLFMGLQPGTTPFALWFSDLQTPTGIKPLALWGPDFCLTLYILGCISLHNLVTKFLNFFSFFLFLFFFFLRAAPAVYGSSQARGGIWAAAAGLRHSHSNSRSEPDPQCTQQLAATPDH